MMLKKVWPTSVIHSTSITQSTDGAFLLELIGKIGSSMEVDKLEGFEPVFACSHFCSYMERTKILQATQFSQKKLKKKKYQFLKKKSFYFLRKITRKILKCEYLRVSIQMFLIFYRPGNFSLTQTMILNTSYIVNC